MTKKNLLLRIWQNSKVLEDMRDFSAYDGKCGACEFIKIFGGCRALERIIFMVAI